MFTTWNEAQEAFDAMLDDCEEKVRIGGLSYLPSRVLREVDPTAYRCLLMDYIDGWGVDSDDLEGACNV